jgi:hypothetical protein
MGPGAHVAYLEKCAIRPALSSEWLREFHFEAGVKCFTGFSPS